MLEISEITKIQQERDLQEEVVNANMKAMVMSKSDMINPVGSKNASKPKFHVILADQTGSQSATVYGDDSYNKFIVGFGVRLENIMIKPGYLAITTRSRVGLYPSFTIPEDVKNNVVSLPGTENLSLEAAVTSPVKSLVNIKGKILQVSAVTQKDVYGELMPFQEVTLQDKSTTTNVALFADLANIFSPGQFVSLTKVRVKLFKDEKKLSTTDQSKYELLTEDSSLEELPEVELESFPDTYRNLHESFEEIKIESVINIDPYLCCTNIKCNNKKLATRKEGDQYKMFCQGCNSTISASKANHYAVGKFGIIRNKTELQEVSMFLPEIKKIMESTGRQLEFSFKPEEFMIHILSALPITVTCRLKGKVVSKVIPKHKLNE